VALTEAIQLADAAGAGWFGAVARVALADVRRERGESASADSLLRQVVEWSRRPVAGTGRVMFYGRIAGDPVAAALDRLAAGEAAANRLAPGAAVGY
jgi:hypothetical protein